MLADFGLITERKKIEIFETCENYISQIQSNQKYMNNTLTKLKKEEKES